jgi:hypothetical protein
MGTMFLRIAAIRQTSAVLQPQIRGQTFATDPLSIWSNFAEKCSDPELTEKCALTPNLEEGQADGEGAAAAGAGAGGVDAAAVQFDQFADQGQAEAEAALGAVEGARSPG